MTGNPTRRHPEVSCTGFVGPPDVDPVPFSQRSEVGPLFTVSVVLVPRYRGRYVHGWTFVVHRPRTGVPSPGDLPPPCWDR